MSVLLLVFASSGFLGSILIIPVSIFYNLLFKYNDF